MNKLTIEAAESKKKPYAKPQIRVIEIDGAELICQSNEGYGEGNTGGWYNN